jgi:ABC-type antimicrobial peptide transport system permease subunit
VKSSDPETYLGAVGMAILVVLLASWLPARHAARLEPMIALRHE